ncbi:MAG: signal peptidase I [Saprospiraceae bacterium]|nr:signal peptidase I [Saprospiraceae bacterium]
MSILIFLVISYILLCISLKPLFISAGYSGTDAYIPGLNFVTWCKIIGRKPTYALWLLFPIVNIFIFCGMAVDMVLSFGRNTFKNSALAVIYAPLEFFLIHNAGDKYKGPAVTRQREFNHELKAAYERKDTFAIKKLEANNPFKKSKIREWVDSIVFAVFAAAFIRMFLIEAYVIPTSSMESSLRVGDYLFVSKAHYGIRLPMTVAMFPLIHNRLPIINRESYLKHPSLPYYRLPALTSIKRFDPVVFNYPEGDSVYVTPSRTFSLYDVRRDPRLAQGYPLTTRPLDKMDHYIKRCIGLPGDTLQIKAKSVYINGAKIDDPTGMQFNCRVTPSQPLALETLRELGVNLNECNPEVGFYSLTKAQREYIKKEVPSAEIEILYANPEQYAGNVFPHNAKLFPTWTPDNYGPIWIPAKGATVTLTPQNIDIYRRVISVYEHNKLEEKDGRFYINGTLTDKYTFKQDYYWMMGDNRDNSEDSRFWGFVPEENIVGKPLFIFFSKYTDQFGSKIRWDRIFSSANKF